MRTRPDIHKISRPPRYGVMFTVLAAAFVVIFFASFALGRYPVSPPTLVKILISRIFVMDRTWESAAETVVMNVRLPRIIAAALIGAAHSCAGAAYQGMFRNPMVSPDILGASTGAGFGAALAIFFYFGYFGISVSAFAFGLAAVGMAYAVSARSRRGAVLSMVLAGMMVSSLFSSATSLIKLIADTDEVLPAITYWLMGSLASIRWPDVGFIALPIILGLAVLFALRWRINLLTAGEEEAMSLGVNTRRLRVMVIVSATLLTATGVAVSGLIGWVGLVIPHFCRMIFGHDYRRLIPSAMLFGATFLVFVDDIARLAATSEIPIGILTSFIGAPVFIYLILTGGDEGER